jgi:hypothetical protein
MGDIFNQMTGTVDGSPLKEEPSGKLQLAFEAAAGSDPERASRIFKMQQVTGLPQDVIETHLEDIETKASSAEFDSDKFRTESPTVASWMAENPQHIALIKDEMDLWGGLEQMITATKESWVNEWDSRERSQLLLREFNGENLSPVEAARRDKLAGDIMYRARQNLSESGSEYFARVNTSGVYQMGQSMKEQIKGAGVGGSLLGVAAAVTAPEVVLPAMALGVTAGAAYSGGAYSYNQEAPLLFDDLRSMKDINGQTIPADDARSVARVTGVLLATVETASGAAVASMIPGVKNIVGKAVGADAAKQAIKNQIKLAMARPTTSAALRSAAVGFVAAPTTEALEEFVQAMISAGGREVAQSVSGQYFAPDDFSKDLASANQQAQDAFVGSIFAMGAPVAGSRMYSGLRDAKTAKQNETYYKALGDVMNRSKASQLLPTKMREVVERVTANGPVEDVYVDSTQFRTYFQNKNIDPREVAREVLGNTEEYDRAVESDTSIRIPITDYATKIAPTEHNAFFAKEVRSAPDAMNSREAEEFTQQAEQSVKDGMSAEKTVKDEVAARLVKLGYEQQTANYIAAQTGAFFETQAKNLGIADPIALMERYGVEIKRGSDEGATYKQDVMPTSLLSSIRDVNRNVTEKYPGHLGEVQADIAARGIEEPVRVTISTSSNMAYVSNGNTRITAAENLGLPTVPVVYEKTVVPLTIEQQRRARPVSELGIDVNSIPDKPLTTQQAADRAALQAILGAKYYQGGSDLLRGADALASLPQSEIDDMDWSAIHALMGKNGLGNVGVAAYNLYEARKLTPKPNGKLKKVTDNNTWSLYQNYDYVINVGGEHYGISKFDDPDAVDGDEDSFVYAYQHLESNSPTVETQTSDVGELVSLLGAKYSQAIRKNPFTKSQVQGVVYHGTAKSFDKFSTGSKPSASKKSIGAVFFTDDASVASDFAMLADGLAKDGLWGDRELQAAEEFLAGRAEYSRKSGDLKALSDAEANLATTKERVTQDFTAMVEAGGANVIPAYLDIQNPLVIDMRGRRVSARVLKEVSEYISVAKSGGNDGVILSNFKDNAYGDAIAEHYVVFGENQIASALTNELMQKERGSITIGPNKEMSINLTEDANLSTFIHETGHMYLEVLRDLTTETGWQKLQQFLGKQIPDSAGRQQLKADGAVIAQWLGAENLDNLTVEQHEQWARGIEAYFMEGKAPSVELRPVFARFRAWLVALYKTVGALGVRLNPEVRAVMDRLFATQEAINTAKKEAQVIPVFATAQEAGMSETEFAAYSKLLADASSRAQEELQQKVMRQLQREQEAEWKRLRSEIRDSVAAQLSSQRPYQVLEYLDQDDNKLSREALYALYPEPFKGNPVMQALHSIDAYRAKDGTAPDVVAGLHGYTSPDEMVRELMATKSYKLAVEEATDVQMKAKYGDIMTDGTLAEEARKFVMGPGRSEVLELELRALRKRQREARPVVSAVVAEQRATRRTGMDALQTATPSLAFVRQVAQDTIAQMRVRSISVQSYLVAAREASSKALAAVHKGEYHIAAYHKQKELLNVELYREAQRVRQEADDIVKYMRTFEESRVRERLGRAGDFYLEQIDAILERFDFSRMTTKDAAKRKALVQWVEERQKAGQQVNLPEEILNEAYRKPWKEMSFDELVGVSDAAKHIKHLATLKNKLLKSKADRELSATVSLLDETIAINARHKDSRTRETRLPQEMMGQAVAGFLAAHRKISSLAREMDGFKDGGPVWESVIWPLNEAAASEAMMHEVSNAKLSELFKPYTTMQEKAKVVATAATAGTFATGIYKKEFIPEINDSLSKVGRLMVALNWGNESNRSRIVEGYGWTPQQVEVVLSALTKEDWDFVQGVWDHIESFWPQIESLAKRVDGIAPKKVEAATVLTPFGEYRGGYFPLKYDDRQSPKAFSHLAKEAADRAMHGAAIRATTAHGERIDRLQHVKMPVRLDFGVINEALNETIHDITHYETLIDLNRIIGNGRVQSSIVAHFGHEVYQQFRSAIRDVAGGDIPAQTQVDKSLNWLRKGTTISGMGWSLMTGLMQPLGITQSIARIGPAHVAKGVGRWLGDAVRMENTVKWIYEKSAIMQERSITQSREINEIRNQVSPSGLLGPVQDSFFYLIVKIQQVVDVPTWLGAYEKGMAEFGDEAKAIAVADQAVLDSQGGGQIKDRAAVQRGGPAQMLWTNFYSYFNTTFNLTAESYRKTEFRNPYAVGRFAADMLLLYTVPAILSMFIRDGLRGDVEDDPDKLLKKMAQQQLSYLVGPVLLARELGGTLQGYYGYEGPAGAQFFAQSAKLAKQVGQGEADEAAFKAMNKTMGILFHYPAGQVERTAEGVAYDMENGTPNPLPILVGPPKE